MSLLKLLRRPRFERAGFMLYGAAVTAARDPFLYGRLGVPDTLDGRFDLISAYVFLIVDRLGAAETPGPELAQAVFDAMFSDMDVNLREMGVGDLSVGRKVKVMWEAFHGRSHAYAAAVRANDAAAMTAALTRNVWRGAAVDPNGPVALARLMFAQAAHLARQEACAMAAGIVDILPAEEACR